MHAGAYPGRLYYYCLQGHIQGGYIINACRGISRGAILLMPARAYPGGLYYYCLQGHIQGGYIINRCTVYPGGLYYYCLQGHIQGGYIINACTGISRWAILLMAARAYPGGLYILLMPAGAYPGGLGYHINIIILQ